MAYWGGGGAAGWSGGDLHGRHGRSDGWDYDELGRVYDPAMMRRLFPFLRPFRLRASIAIAAMIVYSVTSFSQPLLMALAVGEFIENGNSDGLRLDTAGACLVCHGASRAAFRGKPFDSPSAGPPTSDIRVSISCVGGYGSHQRQHRALVSADTGSGNVGNTNPAGRLSKIPRNVFREGSRTVARPA